MAAELLAEKRGTWVPDEVRTVGLGEILPGAILGLGRREVIMACL